MCLNDPENDLTYDDCLNSSEECSGAVEYRTPLSGTGRAFPRCDFHWDERLTEQERITDRFPDSPCSPNWFDPALVGERWEEKD